MPMDDSGFSGKHLCDTWIIQCVNIWLAILTIAFEIFNFLKLISQLYI